MPQGGPAQNKNEIAWDRRRLEPCDGNMVAPFRSHLRDNEERRTGPMSLEKPDPNMVIVPVVPRIIGEGTAPVILMGPKI
jgi:hypothetical protein